jgi:hypothetical protein
LYVCLFTFICNVPECVSIADERRALILYVCLFTITNG